MAHLGAECQLCESMDRPGALPQQQTLPEVTWPSRPGQFPSPCTSRGLPDFSSASNLLSSQQAGRGRVCVRECGSVSRVHTCVAARQARRGGAESTVWAYCGPWLLSHNWRLPPQHIGLPGLLRQGRSCLVCLLRCQPLSNLLSADPQAQPPTLNCRLPPTCYSEGYKGVGYTLQGRLKVSLRGPHNLPSDDIGVTRAQARWLIAGQGGLPGRHSHTCRPHRAHCPLATLPGCFQTGIPPPRAIPTAHGLPAPLLSHELPKRGQQ